ncbi:hypothetical protein [Furfurilactobacillus rossiae]|nr:hypothetical protein [Furfurilactobacillus rossiae]QLE61912.1 hypothetical protein LROSRS0_1867 [Furfurilactobacillus rossiae]
MDDIPAWALEVAAQELGYDTFSDVEPQDYDTVFANAEMMS